MGGSLYRDFRANVYTVGVHGALGTSLWLRAGGLYRVSGFLIQVLGNLGLAHAGLSHDAACDNGAAGHHLRPNREHGGLVSADSIHL